MANTILTVWLKWPGVSHSAEPSDSTGAIGPTRYVELVNRQYAIYDRDGARLIDGPLRDLAPNASGLQQLSDPQVLWDQQTSRFYYSFIIQHGDGNWEIVYGFSTTDSPKSSADFCKATVS